MYENNRPKKRYRLTLDFVSQHISKTDSILDLGVKNPLSQLLKSKGFDIYNTGGEDLDIDFSSVENSTTEVVSAFEILEHLVAPFNVLSKIKSKKLIASVPLKLWFASAYKSKTDPWDRHFHEFEDWQFDWLLQKSGWEIKATKKMDKPYKKNRFSPYTKTVYTKILHYLR
jgi:hypothetical protein